MDVDGVLTDGTVSLDQDGREIRTVNFKDVMAVSLGRRAGLVFALVSGEGGPLLDVIASKLGITDVYPRCKDKAAAVRDFAERHEVDLNEVCFIGDDVNDVEAMTVCGFGAAPANAHRSAANQAKLVTTRAGGAGAVREVIDYLLPGGALP